MKTLTLRNHANTQSMQIKVDIFASNSELTTDGFETRYTNMVIENYGDDDKATIDLRPIENSWQGIIAAVKALPGIGLFLFDLNDFSSDTDQQEDEITLSGTSGTATISVDGNDYTATFDTDLETTANNFVTAEAANVLADTGGVLTSPSAGVLKVVGVDGEEYPVTIANASGDLDGTIENTVLAKTGTGQITIVAPHHEVVA